MPVSGKRGIVIFVGETEGGWRTDEGGGETGSANSRDMSRLLDVMTAVEMDDNLPLILINHLGMQRWLIARHGNSGPKGCPAPSCRGGRGVTIYNLNAGRAAQSGPRTVLYLMLPSIVIVELLKLIPPPPPPSPSPARGSGSIEVNYSLDSARDETSSSLRVGLLRPIKKSRKRAFTVISSEEGRRLSVPGDLPETTSSPDTNASSRANDVLRVLEYPLTTRNVGTIPPCHHLSPVFSFKYHPLFVLQK